jgi:hypothetical protein
MLVGDGIIADRQQDDAAAGEPAGAANQKSDPLGGEGMRPVQVLAHGVEEIAS